MCKPERKDLRDKLPDVGLDPRQRRRVAERLSRAKFSARVLGLQLVKLEYLGDLL